MKVTPELCLHCWHVKRGPTWVVLEDGFVVQECCKCHITKAVHADHVKIARFGKEMLSDQT